MVVNKDETILDRQFLEEFQQLFMPFNRDKRPHIIFFHFFQISPVWLLLNTFSQSSKPCLSGFTSNFNQRYTVFKNKDKNILNYFLQRLPFLADVGGRQPATEFASRPCPAARKIPGVDGISTERRPVKSRQMGQSQLDGELLRVYIHPVGTRYLTRFSTRATGATCNSLVMRFALLLFHPSLTSLAPTSFHWIVLPAAKRLAWEFSQTLNVP